MWPLSLLPNMSLTVMFICCCVFSFLLFAVAERDGSFHSAGRLFIAAFRNHTYTFKTFGFAQKKKKKKIPPPNTCTDECMCVCVCGECEVC